MEKYFLILINLLVFSNASTTKRSISDISEFCELDKLDQTKLKCADFNIQNNEGFVISTDLFFMDNILTVQFENCVMPKIPVNSFDVFPKIRNLEIDNCHLKNIKKTSELMVKLKTLNLTNNEIEYLTNSNGFSHMRRLDLSGNKINKIEANAFCTDEEYKRFTLYALDDLDLSANNIEFIDHLLFPVRINYLYLNKNKIKKVGNKVFSKLMFLHVLDLSDNLIESLPENFVDISEYHKYFYLNLQNNKIKTLNENIFSKVPIDIILNLSENPIGDNIRHLKCETLKSLNISSVNLQNLDYNTFSHLKNIETLDLSNNQLKTFEAHVIYPLNSLKTLFLDGNNLKEIDYEDEKLISKNLTQIGLTRNQWNCKYLQDMIKFLNKKMINYMVPDNHQYIGDRNIAGIGCYDMELSDSKSDDQIISKLIASVLETNKDILKYGKLNYDIHQEILEVLGRNTKD